MRYWILAATLLHTATSAQPAPELPKDQNVLFWTQDQRDASFRAMEKIVKTNTINTGGPVHPLTGREGQTPHPPPGETVRWRKAKFGRRFYKDDTALGTKRLQQGVDGAVERRREGPPAIGLCPAGINAIDQEDVVFRVQARWSGFGVNRPTRHQDDSLQGRVGGDVRHHLVIEACAPARDIPVPDDRYPDQRR